MFLIKSFFFYVEKLDPCKSGYFRCQSGHCIQEHKLCDDINDCPQGDDEKVTVCWDGGNGMFLKDYWIYNYKC